jgi:hypothetical protein
MDRCPTCKAKFIGEVICYRCKSDLTLLLDIEKQALFYRSRALRYLQRGKPAKALKAVKKSLFFKRTEESRQLEIRIRAYLGDFCGILNEVREGF